VIARSNKPWKVSNRIQPNHDCIGGATSIVILLSKGLAYSEFCTKLILFTAYWYQPHSVLLRSQNWDWNDCVVKRHYITWLWNTDCCILLDIYRALVILSDLRLFLRCVCYVTLRKLAVCFQNFVIVCILDNLDGYSFMNTTSLQSELNLGYIVSVTIAGGLSVSRLPLVCTLDINECTVSDRLIYISQCKQVFSLYVLCCILSLCYIFDH
jgi:hypothetical protein